MATNESDNAKLVEINSKTLGASMPEVTLKDGSRVQTGTVGALLANIKTYDALTEQATSQEKEDLESAFRMAIPLLVKAGMFNLFEPDEWIGTPVPAKSPGRRYVGTFAKEYLAKQAKATG